MRRRSALARAAGARGVTRDPAANSVPEIGSRWSELAGRLAQELAHEVRNPLNGAMVNVQVVASRAGRAGQDAAALEPFAVAASSEMERAAALVESLLSALRPPRPGAEVATTLRPLVVLYAAVAARHGGVLEMEAEGSGSGATGADSALVRVALAAVLDAATRDAGGGRVSLVLHRGDAGVTVRVHGSRALPELDRELAELLASGGAGFRQSTSEYLLNFPAASATQ
jgi:two-component system, NtrC family, sensor histidine kinase HydH